MWGEFGRSLPDGVDPAQFRRRLGRVDFDLVLLDLTSPDLLGSLGIETADLTKDDLALCQTLAELAAAAGFDAVLGPSAAHEGETTLAVFGDAIRRTSSAVRDLGVRTPPDPGSDPSLRRRR